MSSALRDSLNLDFERVDPHGMPEGWYAGGGGSAGAKSEDYRGSLDSDDPKSGKYSLRLTYNNGVGGVATNALDLIPYRGHKIRYSAFVKSNDVKRAMLWFRVDTANGKPMTISYSPDVIGTRDWTRLENTIFIDQKATHSNFGFLVSGPGDAWIDDFRIEVVE